MTEFIVVIPTRYGSTRLPGKPLLPLAGKPVLQHVWERGSESDARQVIIATDDRRIADAATAFGADVCMTSSDHDSGSDRLAEVCDLRGWSGDQVIVNLQGDEPMMPAALINHCAALLDEAGIEIATLASALIGESGLTDPNSVKVLLDTEGRALYFSRASIPYARRPECRGLAVSAAMQHHGIYAYRVAALRRMVAAPRPAIERCEELEQLRALYLGMRIRVGHAPSRPGPGIDTESDLRAAERLLTGE